MTRPWDELRPELERIVFRKGVTSVSHLIPAGRTAIYDMINGRTTEPSHAMRAGVERLVESERSSGSEHPEDPAA